MEIYKNSLIFLLLISLTLVVSIQVGKADEADVFNAFGVQPYKGNIIAPVFSLKDLNGRMVKLSDYRGNIVMIGFFTTW